MTRLFSCELPGVRILVDATVDNTKVRQQAHARKKYWLFIGRFSAFVVFDVTLVFPIPAFPPQCVIWSVISVLLVNLTTSRYAISIV